MRLSAEERASLHEYLANEAKTQEWAGFSWASSSEALAALDDTEAEMARLREMIVEERAQRIWNEKPISKRIPWSEVSQGIKDELRDHARLTLGQAKGDE